MKNILFLLITFAFPFFIYAENIENLGLVSGLWFSSDQILESQEVTVNAVFFNESSFNTTGQIEFFDNNDNFYQKKIIVPKKSIIHIKVPYSGTEGNREITAKITKATQIQTAGGEKTEIIPLQDEVFASQIIKVEKDTDKDGLGDSTDKDDDGDGIPDEIEIDLGSDPLDKLSIPDPKKIAQTQKIQEIKEDITKTASTASKKAAEIASAGATTANSIREKIVETLESEIKKEKEGFEIKKIPTPNLNAKDNFAKILNSTNTNPQETNPEKSFYFIFLNSALFVFKNKFFTIIIAFLMIYFTYKILKWIFLKKRNSHEYEYDD